MLGASGNTGGAVTKTLQAYGARTSGAQTSGAPSSGMSPSGMSIRTTSTKDVRSTGTDHVRFDWSDPDTYATAVAGVDRVYLIAPVGVADPVPPVEAFLAEARRAGVQRTVFLSSSAVRTGDPGLGQVASLVQSVMPEWAVLRPTWFMQNFVGRHPLAEAIRSSREFDTAAGDGKQAFVDAGDIGATAAALLLDDTAHNSEFYVTGPESISYDDAAAVLTEAIGEPIRHIAVSVEQRVRQYVDSGYPADFSASLAGLDDLIRTGQNDFVADTVNRFTGRPPRSLQEFMSEHRDKLLTPA
ncbi:ergot alkaloid biosynthesis protein [Streptomyces sp. KL118A]|uniref:NmrA family NAD(P)-binding protein n=1 Tax=Streptomyces sp. KL118A TaxID=3045153 RepID=UPI003531F76C